MTALYRALIAAAVLDGLALAASIYGRPRLAIVLVILVAFVLVGSAMLLANRQERP